MRAVIQRVSEASVMIHGKVHGHISKGLLVLLGIEESDEKKDADWLAAKIVGMRIFNDDEGLMNLSLKEVDGDILLISQFTLHAKTKKGNRPSFITAAKPEKAVPLYEYFIQQTETLFNKKIQTGIFGADMKVLLVNDGPVTIIIDSQTEV